MHLCITTFFISCWWKHCAPLLYLTYVHPSPLPWPQALGVWVCVHRHTHTLLGPAKFSIWVSMFLFTFAFLCFFPRDSVLMSNVWKCCILALLLLARKIKLNCFGKVLSALLKWSTISTSFHLSNMKKFTVSCCISKACLLFESDFTSQCQN